MTALWVALFAATLLWSGIGPHDRLTWVMEVAPAVIALPILAATRWRFPLTPLTYWLILVHAVILMVGGHYTYAEVPLFDWIRDATGGTRNNYDKVGHLAQGFFPAIVAREVLVRLRAVNGRGWLAFTVICFCLAVSALYELIEWWAALLIGEDANSFLGTQGYAWDTQSDMFLALLGAAAALALLSRAHDRQLARLAPAAR